ncbi:ankyrin repeat and LEM domain-containing protein 1 isoform X2 [Cuculus canorus]|uniref:ankyrin repeat and LEM domain-containing protein 1 isoform X2 n=1 Tax=Cuculus canorus TaxID=55661 RepID=UPI0023AB24C6|nr:ankyrin repeat and LEM domain-containing protein 1 isoform X2 [Cuculus canorus]
MPVTTSRGHCRCLEKNWGGLELPHQDGTQATDLERGTHACARIPWDSQRAQGWDLVQDLGDPRCSLSFLSEDITEDIAGPLSSTRRSLQEELDLGGDCSLGDPLPLSVASRAPWPHADPGGSAVSPQPLASSTLLATGDVLSEGPQRQIVGGRRRGPPWGLPRPSPQQSFGPRGSPRPPQPQCCRRVWGGHEASPQAPLLRGGCGPRDGDVPGARARLHAGAPQGPSVGWAGLGVPVLAVPTPGSGVRDTSSAGDTSGTSECFFSALETLEPSEAGGCQGAQHPRSPQPRAVVGPELGEAPSPPGAAALALPPDSPPSAERVQRGGLRGGSRAAPCSEDELGVSGVGGLLVQLKGCSLRETPPHTAEPPSSLAIIAAGDVPPEGPEPPRYLHVTPRTKRRLQASAARLGVSSSSSLFEETLEMPRRPPRVRAPWGVPRDPPTAVGLCIASGGEEVASGDGEGTGSMDDTEILPGDPNQPSSPRATSSSPGSSPTILLVPGDHGHPQDIPSDGQGSSPTILLVPGDHGHPQDIPSNARGSSPTVLLVPGDHGHPQDIPSDGQGSSPTVLLVPGDHGHPQDIPSDGQGSSPTILLVPGDHGHPQDIPSNAQGSSPTVLLVPGDHGHPQDIPSDARGSSPTVLLVPGDHGHPQDIPSNAQGSSPTILLVPGDHGHPQDIPSDAQGSSPTILLVPGDHGHPQDIPSNARGSSPTILLVHGDRGHPQDIPSNARGCPRGTGSHSPRLLEDVSWWQDPSPLGTRLGHLLAPRPPRSPVVEPGSPATLSSPMGHGTHRAGEQLQDEEQGPAPTEPHSPGTEATASPEDTTVEDSRACPARPRPLSDEGLRRRLRALGDDPGPITDLTRRLYLWRLEKLVRRRQRTAGGHSPELVAALRSGRIPDCAQDELVLAQQFDHPDRNRHWREGLVKSSFNYLLLDPRTTQNLPLRSHRLSSAECFRTFIKAIFYVGKGTRARPYCHLAEALSQHRAGKQEGCPKVRRILEIWASGQGVISVHCFQNTIPAEAYTRESCLVEALGLWAITNQRKGNCYGAVASWPAEQRRRLGVHMLHRVMRIFLAEGERQLRPSDIQGGR